MDLDDFDFLLCFVWVLGRYLRHHVQGTQRRHEREDMLFVEILVVKKLNLQTMYARLMKFLNDLVDGIPLYINIKWNDSFHEPVKVAHLRWIWSLKVLELIQARLDGLRHCSRPLLQQIRCHHHL